MPLVASNLVFGYRPAPARPLLGAAEPLSLSLRPGAVTAILGPNGCGKSTLLRLLLGTLRPWFGQVTLQDRPLQDWDWPGRARRIAFVSQRPELTEPMTVAQAVALGAMHGPPPAHAAVLASLDRVDLADRAAEPLAHLSAGQQQRAALARALLQLAVAPGPGQVLLADEPFAALDPRHALQVLALLRELAASGVAVAAVMHDLTAARRASDFAAVLADDGRLVAFGPTPAVVTPAVLSTVYRLPLVELGPPHAPAIVPEPPPPPTAG